MEQAVAFMIGISAMVIGLSLFFHSKGWSEYLAHVRQMGQPAALIIGYLHLLAGTFIVGFHWKWEGLPLLLTLLGVKAIAEGVVYTLFPSGMLAMLGWYGSRSRMLFRIGGLVTVIIGLLIINEWWQYIQSDACTWHPCFNQAQLDGGYTAR